jgi:hypothetical protein
VLANIYLFVLFLHPFHVSVTEVDWNEELQSAEITCRVFYDDFEVATGVRVDDLTNEVVEKYVREKFTFRLDESEKEMNFVGFEFQQDVVFIYWEYKSIKDFNNILIENRILLEVYDDQENIIHIQKKDKIKSLRINHSNLNGVVIW